MGYLSALAITGSETTLEQQVSWHFSSNCYPPVPQYMVPFAVEAIERAISDDWDSHIDCPEGVSWRGQTSVAVYNIIENLHLNAFVDASFEEVDE